MIEVTCGWGFQSYLLCLSISFIIETDHNTVYLLNISQVSFKPPGSYYNNIKTVFSRIDIPIGLLTASQYLNQCWYIDNWTSTTRVKFVQFKQTNKKKNENGVCKMVAILFQSQCIEHFHNFDHAHKSRAVHEHFVLTAKVSIFIHLHVRMSFIIINDGFIDNWFQTPKAFMTWVIVFVFNSSSPRQNGNKITGDNFQYNFDKKIINYSFFYFKPVAWGVIDNKSPLVKKIQSNL